VTFSELSGYLDRLESTSSRNELVKTLAELYAKTSSDEIQPLTYLIQGRLVPFFEPVEIGLGEKLVMAAIAQAFANYGGDHQEEARASRIARATSRETVSGCTVTRFFSPLIPGTLCTARSMASR